MKKAQSAVESAMLITLMTIVLTAFLFITLQRYQEVSVEHEKQLLEDVGLFIENEIHLAQAAEPGYSRTFSLLPTLAGAPYSVTILGSTENFTEIVIRYEGDEGTYEQIVLVPAAIYGTTCLGENVIEKSAEDALNIRCNECKDGIDNADGDGCIDMLDPDCLILGSTQELSYDECLSECNNNIDDDYDGCKDASDSACLSGDTETGGICICPATGTPEGCVDPGSSPDYCEIIDLDGQIVPNCVDCYPSCGGGGMGCHESSGQCIPQTLTCYTQTSSCTFPEIEVLSLSATDNAHGSAEISLDLYTVSGRVGHISFNTADGTTELVSGATPTTTGSPQIDDTGKVGEAMKFKGPEGPTGNDYLDYGDIFNVASDATVELWFKSDLDISETNSPINTSPLFSKYDDLDYQFGIYIAGTNNEYIPATLSVGELYAKIEDVGVAPGAPVVRSQLTTWNKGEWNHVAVTIPQLPGQMELWVNGIKVGEEPTQGQTLDISQSASVTFGGAPVDQHAGWANYFNGSIDEVLVYDRILTKEEIIAHSRNGPGYTNKVCCVVGPDTLSTVCDGTTNAILNLSDRHNAHAEKKDQGNYPVGLCISATLSTINCGYEQGVACAAAGWDTCVAKLSGLTDAHLGTCADSAYGLSACCSYT